MKHILITTITAVLLGGALELRAMEKPTNFVIFLTDDLGWGDLGVQGHPLIKTPNLDQFAKEGVRLAQCLSLIHISEPTRQEAIS